MKVQGAYVVVQVCVALSLLFAADTPLAQSPEGASVEGNSIPLTALISSVAKRTNKKFIVDPRVRADVLLIGSSPSSISYGDFLEVLQVHGFTAVEGAEFVRIMPDASVRHFPLPIAQGKEKRFDAEYVTKIIPVRNTPAMMLVPTLRPLLPQQAHLAAVVCTNDLIVVDTVANVRRIEALVQSLDKGEGFKAEQCNTRQMTSAESKLSQ